MTGTGSHEPSNPPAADSFSAVYLDGQTNRKHRVTLKPSAALEIAEDGAFLAAWAYGDIRRADGPKYILRLRNIAAAKLARLEVADPSAQAELQRLCTLLDGEGTAGDVSTTRIVFWSLAAAASLMAVTWFGVPLIAARLTALVPLSWEKRLGDVADRQVRANLRPALAGYFTAASEHGSYFRGGERGRASRAGLSRSFARGGCARGARRP